MPSIEQVSAADLPRLAGQAGIAALVIVVSEDEFFREPMSRRDMAIFVALMLLSIGFWIGVGVVLARSLA